jgi:hypothetical protein
MLWMAFVSLVYTVVAEPWLARSGPLTKRKIMAGARFQVFVFYPERTRPSSVTADDERVMWRFLSANNRSLGQAVDPFMDKVSCLSALRTLRDGLGSADVLTVRDPRGMWLWRLRVEGADVAVSSRRYQRRLNAKHAGNSFHRLAAGVSDINELPIVHF